MNKILYAPILGIMEQRESVINGNYKIADENNTKVKILSEEKEEIYHQGTRGTHTYDLQDCRFQ